MRWFVRANCLFSSTTERKHASWQGIDETRWCDTEIIVDFPKCTTGAKIKGFAIRDDEIVELLSRGEETINRINTDRQS